jgi:hypothetical protein
MSLPEIFGSAAGTFIRENKRKQLGKSLGNGAGRTGRPIADPRGWSPGRAPFVTESVNFQLRQLDWRGTMRLTSLPKVDGGLGEMFILFLNWLGRQCPTTRCLSGIPSDGLQPGKMRRHHFPIGARRPPPTNNRWLSHWLSQHDETSAHMQRVGLSQG